MMVSYHCNPVTLSVLVHCAPVFILSWLLTILTQYSVLISHHSGPGNITNVIPFTSYQVTVTACTAGGCTESTAVAVRTLQEGQSRQRHKNTHTLDSNVHLPDCLTSSACQLKLLDFLPWHAYYSVSWSLLFTPRTTSITLLVDLM